MDFILEFLQMNMTEIQTFNIPEIQTLNITETDQTHFFQIIHNSEYEPDYSGVSLIMPNILKISLLIIISNIRLNSF